MKNYLNKLGLIVLTFLLSFGIANAVTLFKVQQGGTGRGTFTSAGVLYGNGTNGLLVTAGCADGEIIKYASGVPACGADTTGSGSGTPGGADTQVQFNDGGNFGGDAGFVYDKTANSIDLDGNLVVHGDTGLEDLSTNDIDAVGLHVAGSALFDSTISGSIDGNAATATLAATNTVIDSTDASSFIAMFDSATGNMAIKTDAGLTYNATTANLTTTTFTGALVGNSSTSTLASTETVVDSTDATSFPAMFDSATGSLAVKTDGGLTYDASNATLTATTFVGALTGNSTTATALAANPADCGANSFAISIVALGTLTCATPTLGTDTNGNFVQSVTTSVLTGLTGGNTAGEATDSALAFDYSQALSGDVGLATKTGVFGQNGFAFEGTTADTIETFIVITDPTATDKTITIPNRTGTVSLSGDTFTSDVTGTLDSSGATALTVAANAVALTTDTTGNYVSSATASGGLALTGTEGGSLGMITSCSDNQLLKYTGAGGWACASDNDSGGSTAWDNIADPSASATVAFAGTTQTITGNTNDVTAIAQDLLSLSYTNDAATDVLVQRGLFIQNESSTNGMEALIALNNNDPDTVVTSGLIINSAAGAITNAIDLSDSDIVNAIVTGANDLSGTNWSIAGATGNIIGGTITANTRFAADADDGSVLGASGTGFSDLFLAEGAVINWDSADATITQTGNDITVAGITTFGVGTSTAVTLGTIETGAASDTTIARVGAGQISVEGVNIVTTSSTDTLTNKTIGAGALTLAENASVALDPAGSADGKYSGTTVTGTGGATIAFGDLVTLDKDDSRWELVDISVAAAATGDARGILGIAVTSSTDGNPITVLLNGIVRADANFPTLTIGAAVYASTTGDIVVTQPSTVDYVIRIIGNALTGDEFYFDPDNVWITHT